ncbi:MAG TPA: endonuclease/exonuclease/phosphatase [Cyanobacteria bacterium UBA11149]|nr:endonuclease/exonuclease/phosphatase [Cyanobacteria bacterium UBA11367]HBE60568.1 endonuclease/exonuclease/phosphatase [Cyanobacteria bacterium UBA11366]HBK63798.1 endonuclease/exonuclease/phosphatase [Cyanobacteria bacterium UBA11166]HBR72905.1 endonuclease/exonuclease/phosphatase [Cyanobacteria bacterium UBA11159]HBS69017.1 endonuclease/exonuclease/phosphatase [Cyanobacteria bacterium UBA11153]HBW89578.1 endonuclease/exonuclease/phosphatase [Cyanobacteria bacterium UBA11149]HCA93407.1 en
MTKPRLFSLILAIAIALLSTFTTGCTQVITAQQRTFLDLSLNFLGEYKLPDMKYEDTPVGGLSALTYDRGRDRILALSDDRSNLAPARFYTLALTINSKDPEKIGIADIKIEDVTFIKDENGKNYSPGNIDPEGIALSPKGTVFISSEGVPSKGIAPFIREFDQKTGQLQENLRIPDRFLSNNNTAEAQTPRGVQENLGFEPLTLEPNTLAAASGDPFRLFTATESALIQDTLPSNSTESPRIRLLHYLLGGTIPPILVAEHLYLLDYPPQGALDNGLTELIALDTGGHFLSLERSYGLLGNGAKIYQITLGGASDTSSIVSFQEDISTIAPVKKQLLLDLTDLGIYLDNLEGMTFGPRLPDGSQSLILVSDNNFSNSQVTQFLLFSLKT